MNHRDLWKSPRNQVVILLLTSFCLLFIAAAIPTSRYFTTIGAAIAAIVAVMRSLHSISLKVAAIHAFTKEMPTRVGLTLAPEMHSMHVILTRFPECNIPTTSWSLRFTNLHAVMEILDERQPQTIVEFGSGISTLLLAAWLRERGQGRLISFDHDESWAKCTKFRLEQNGLASWVSIVCAPLVETASFGRASLWYNADQELSNLSDVGLVVVDGPPRNSSNGALARLPAFVKMYSALADDCWIVLDDMIRADEQEIVNIWTAHYPDFALRILPGYSGAAILHRSQRLTEPVKTQL